MLNKNWDLSMCPLFVAAGMRTFQDGRREVVAAGLVLPLQDNSANRDVFDRMHAACTTAENAIANRDLSESSCTMHRRVHLLHLQ